MKIKNKILLVIILFVISLIISNNEVFAVGQVSQTWREGANLIYRTFTTPYKKTVDDYHAIAASGTPVGGGWQYKASNGRYYNSTWIQTPGIGNAYPVYRTIRDAYNNSYLQRTNPGLEVDYNSHVFFTLLNMQFQQYGGGRNGLITYSGAPYKNTSYRYAIVNVNGNNVYVEDSIIYNSDLIQLIRNAKLRNITSKCYVSDIILTQSQKNYYDVCPTAYSFFQNGIIGWGEGTKGLTSKGMGSVINLYDNELYFPAFAKRTVLIRHINVGANTIISPNIIRNSTRIPSTQLWLTAINTTERTVYGSNNSYRYLGYEEYYEGNIDIEEAIRKNALPNTTTYRWLGYNVGIGNSEVAANNTINNNVNNSYFQRSNQVYVGGKDILEQNDYVVIDFYYTTYEKDVVVNHLYVNASSGIKEQNEQNIMPNTNAKVGNNTIYRTNNDYYIKEVYKKEMGKDVTVRIADSLLEYMNNDSINGEGIIKKVKYEGYQDFQSYTDYKNINMIKIDGPSTTDTFTTAKNNNQINFYYSVNRQNMRRME